MKISRQGFSLVELLTVIAVIAILSSLVLAGLSKARATARRTQCMSNIKQVATALDMFANNNKDRYPLATGQHNWGDTPEKGWMEQIFNEYVKDKAIYKCPSFPKNISDYHYFLSTRAAYINANNNFATTFRELIKYPTSFVMTGDTNHMFAEPDCDKDDYTQNCLGWQADATHREPLHSGGMNVSFLDTHVKWFDKYDSERMTFRYKVMSDW